jgi:hypothetical protein
VSVDETREKGKAIGCINMLLQNSKCKTEGREKKERKKGEEIGG